MEQKIDELLKQLHKFLFADSEQVINELRIYLLDSTLKEADLAFISSKIFNSKLSFLEFLRQNSLTNEKLLSSVKKKIYELMIEFMKTRQREMSPYLQQIKDTCLLSFRSDQNALVKESSLHLILKIIEGFNHKEIESIIKPKELMIILLDEIKLRKVSASVKGTIWNLVGLLHEKYGLDDYRVESQDVMFIQLTEQMKSEKPEIKAIIGILKGFTYSLIGDCTLDEDQIDGLFVCLKTSIQPIQDMQHKGVMKAGMKLLGTHIRIFKKHITKHAIDLVTLNLKLCVNENIEVRDGANEMLGKIMQQISDGLTNDHSIHKDIFMNIISKFQEILEDPNHANVLLISTIKAVGIFSKAIQTFMGDDQLWKYLERLIEVSDIKIIKEFEQQEDPKNDFKNFKQILKKQKQLISFIESYSFIIQNLKQSPTENFLLHFYKVCTIGVRHHRKLYPKYRERFYDALANFTMSLSHHKTAFIQWIKKFIRSSLIDTLKIPDAVIFGGESPFESLQDAVQFWRDWLNKDQIWTEFTCGIVYDELLRRILEDIDGLNLTYKVEKGLGKKNDRINNEEQKQATIVNESNIGLAQDYIVQYIANNNTDQQYLVRLSNFVEMFLVQCKDEWFLSWAPSFCSTIIKKSSQTPRISKLYSLLKTAMQICSKHKYFEVKEESLKGEKLNTYNMLLTFFKELIGKQEEYQDELLISCLDLLLHVPVSILYRKDKRTDNIYLWKQVMFKSLEIGHTNNQLAFNAISMLEQWFNLLPMNVTVELYHDVLPKLSDFLHVEEDKKLKKKVDTDEYQYVEMLKSGNESKVERIEIAQKVLDLLGKIGGHAHSIINNEQTKIHEKENFIKWDPEKRLKFTIPLYTKKVDIYLDSCLPKLIDLAQNSTDRETRIASCEFLHALIIYMIGKNATQPKGGRGAKEQEQDIAPFAKIYQKLFPVIIKLATESEQISRSLFEPLIFQIVRWFSSSRVYEHPEVESLLDALIEGASSRNNSALREMCSNAVAEFAKWSLKQMSDKDIKENPNNIKSLIRRIESNSNHPDPFKRLSSVLCFSKIFSIIREFDPLVDRFCLEIAHCVLGSLKMCHNSLEFSQEVIDNCSKLLEKIQKVMEKKSSILMQQNSKRSIHPTIFTFMLYLFEKFTSVEMICRRECMKLWEGLVRSLPPKNAEKMPDNPKSWIFDYYMNRRGDKSIFRRLMRINFEEEKQIGGRDSDMYSGSQNNAAIRGKKNQKLSEKQKQLDMLTGQLECFQFILSKNMATYQEIVSKLIDEQLWIGNLRSFINDFIMTKYKKNVSKTVEKMFICKEDKESFTKSKIILITQLFKYLLALDEKSLIQHIKKLEDQQQDFRVFDFAMQILLIPMIHQLQVLVEDQELERSLWKQSELLIQRLQEKVNYNIMDSLEKRVIPAIRIIDLDRIKPTNVQQYHPKMLMSMCLGYLKLSMIDNQVKEYLIKKKHLTTVIEEWLQKDSPLENESSRILVKFLSKLAIPNQILCEWLTDKYEVYQKTNDLLLQYISDNWTNERFQVGEYIITKTTESKSLLGVFLPILEMIHQKTPYYQNVLLRVIPREWAKRPFQSYDQAVTQIKIYSFIANNCKAQLHDKTNKDGLIFIDHCCETISYFLRDQFSPHLKKEVLHLVGLIYNLNTQRGDPVHERLNDSLLNVQKQFFPIKTRELTKNSNEAINFNIIIDGFLNLLILSKNLKTDQSIDDNLRWAIMRKIIMKILETCDQTYLQEIMINYTPKFEEILKKAPHEFRDDPLEMYMLVKTKTYVLLCFEIMFRRLKSETIKTVVHKKLYGENSQGNEITKFLISTCHNSKRSHIEGFIHNVKDQIQTDFKQYNSPNQVQRQYCCAAYSCLTAIIMNTQTKENLFSQFLFTTQREKGDESLLSLLVDQEQNYNFEVETNFNYIQLKNIELKLEKAAEIQGKDIAQIRANNLINEYVTTSFMSANEKFNSAMVFETQPDQINMRTEEEKLQKLISEKSTEPSSSVGEGEEKEDKEQLELDYVNKHECMKNIKRCIDRMIELFGEGWEKEPGQMPLFIPNLFAPYASHWFEPITAYISEKNNGGKGFHYFMRDLCTLLISWTHFTPEDSSKNKIICTNVVNTLIKYAADKTKMIFNTNIQIIASLLHRWKKLIAVNKDMLANMISMDEKKEGSNLWKMTGIQILALTVSFDIPVLEKPENITQLPQNQKQFRLQELHEAKNGDKILVSLLKILDSKKKQIIQAASETLGKILGKQPSLTKMCIQSIFANEANDRHDVLVNSIEKITREYPELLTERKIFLKLISFVKILTGTMRNAIFKCFERYLYVCRDKKLLDDINEITMALFADSDDILSDISNENQQSFIQLLTVIAKLNIDTGDKLISKVLPRLKELFIGNKNDYSRGLFYDLMVFLYDSFNHFRSQVKSALIRGLSDKTKVVRDKLISFWSDPARLSLDPNARIQQLMGELYVPEEEHIWLNNAVYLLMQITSQSSDFERKIFDQPLQDCKFHPLEINQFGHNLNRSQPLTPLFSQMDQIFQASQAASRENQQNQLAPIPESDQEIQAEQDKDIEMIDTTTAANTNPNKRVQQARRPVIRPSQMDSQAVVEISDTQAYNAGLIRATQIPVFTQTLTDQSSLIAANFAGNNQASPIMDSISASFFEINKLNKKKAGQVVAIKTGASPPQDDVGEDGFIAPVARKKGKAHLAKFFAQNQYVYKPFESQGQKIRYIPQGSMPMHLQKEEEIRKMQREQFYNRKIQMQKQQVGLYRKYRVGELPDIQINFKDVLLPLMALIKGDTTIATEIFVELFSEIYKNLNTKEERNTFGEGVKVLLNSSIVYDYGCINCLHRLAMELLKIDGFTINAGIIQRTGQHSMSFQTSLVLLEETIIHGSEIEDEEYQKAINQQVKKRKQDNQKQVQKSIKSFSFSGITDSNRRYWFNLINLYEQIADDDALQGIWSFLADEEGVIFKKKNEEVKQSQQMSQDQEQAVNLIKQAHMLRSKGSISEGLQLLEEALQDPKLNDYFEEHIKIELQNKRLESKAELLKWDEIASELDHQFGGKQLSEIPYQHADKLIKAQIRTDQYWQVITKRVEDWQSDKLSKAYLDKNFNYEMALIALTCKDYDRARFYLDRETNELLTQWKNLTKLSQIAQHILVQKIQKIYEMKEFLSIIKSEGIQSKAEIMPVVIKSIQTWIQRVPSYAFDKIQVWDDILTARNLFLDLYNYRMKGEFQEAISQNRDMSDIRAILQVQCAKGSFKMGLYDCSDRFLKKALRMRKSDQQDSGSNMKIVGPIIKLKSEQFKSEAMNLSFQEKAQKLQKIIGVLESKIKESFVLKHDDTKTEIKGLMLRQQLEKKMLNIILDAVRQEENIKQLKQYEEGLNTYLGKTFRTLGDIFDKVKTAAAYDDQMKHTMAKTYFKMAQFTDKILRKMENESCNIMLKKGLQNLKKSEEELARQTIKNGLLSLNHEYQKASDIIPRLLDVVSKYKDNVEGEFIAHSKDTPVWFFLRWINQIVAIVNRSESSVIEEKVIQIAKRYPQALYYPFKVIESNIQVNMLDSDIQITPLFKKLQQFYSQSFNNLNSWIEALDCLVYPEHRFKYWSQILQDFLSEEGQGPKIQKAKLQELVRMMLEDIAEPERPLVGDRIGSYNRKFGEKWGKQLVKVLGQGGSNVERMNAKQLLQTITNFTYKLQENMGALGQGYEKLSTFSEWLDSLDINDFYNPYEYIELPGQYEGLTSEPTSEKNVKIASVRKTLLILGSIRRPKRITVHGSNEKDYHLLVKGGEDLRLDQRVQQLFQIMNSIFKDDPYCENRDLYIKTFNVVPITNRLGTLEWVDNTEPMKNLINREHMRIEGGKDLNQSRALAERRKWLKTVPGNAKKESIPEQHLVLLGFEDHKNVIDNFNKHKDAMPWYLLRNGLENLCFTSSAFLAIKNQFIKSLATFSIASYLIGIGDRHLENYLIDTSDGEILGIDFGIAFGSGVHLGIPELMPFRLTQQIEGVIAPHPLEGVYKQTMVHALTALRKRKSLILDTCEIFVKEPLLDWVKDAKQRQKSSEQVQQNSDAAMSSILSEFEEELQELAWYPRKKIEIVKDKLNGLNPIKIIAKELKDSKHEKRPYIRCLTAVITGVDENSRRKQLLKEKKKYLEVDEQIDCLIEQAKDPNILGRTWIGWSPYV